MRPHNPGFSGSEPAVATAGKKPQSGFHLWQLGHSERSPFNTTVQGILDKSHDLGVVFLPGDFCGQRSLAGYGPGGRQESDKTEQLTKTSGRGFPGGYACQRRRRGFDPCVGKISWRRKQQPTPVLLPGKSHGLRTLAGYSPGGHRRVSATKQQKQPKPQSSQVRTQGGRLSRPPGRRGGLSASRALRPQEAGAPRMGPPLPTLLPWWLPLLSEDKFLPSFQGHPRKGRGFCSSARRKGPGSVHGAREEPRGVTRDHDHQYFQLLPRTVLTGVAT